MKILYHHRVASKDGQYVHIDEIVSGLRELGHEVILVEPKSLQSKQFGESSGLVGNLRKLLPGFVHELLEFTYSFVDYYRLLSVIRETKPDCIYERYNLFFPSGIWAARRCGLPFILEVNSPLEEERREHGGLQLKRLANWSERYVWQNADLVLPVTAVLGRRIKAKGVSEEKIQVIPNGVNIQQFGSEAIKVTERTRLKLEDKLVLGFAGFVREWHRLDRVLDVIAAHKNTNWHLLLVGDGPARPTLEQRARLLGIADRLTITGIVGREQMPAYMSAFDIALQPDVVEYASPLKLFEYLALGKAIIAPDKANIREVLTHNETALLFDMHCDRDFSEKLLELCESELTRRRLAQAGQKLIEEKGYYWIENAVKIESAFRKLLDTAGMHISEEIV